MIALDRSSSLHIADRFGWNSCRVISSVNDFSIFNSCPQRTSGTIRPCSKNTTTMSLPWLAKSLEKCDLVFGLFFDGKKYHVPGFLGNSLEAATNPHNLSCLTAAARFRFGSIGSIATNGEPNARALES